MERGEFAFEKYDPKELLMSLPTMKYLKAKHGDLKECSICMDDFEENEQLRQLQCNHHFHSKCIDKWL